MQVITMKDVGMGTGQFFRQWQQDFLQDALLSGNVNSPFKV
jgi:hypothetical protein